MPHEELKVPERLFRSINFTREDVDEENRSVELSFSSETDEVDRWFGKEILGHRKGEIEMDWINSGNAPVLIDHRNSVRDGQVGVIEKAWVKGGRGYALVRFGKGALAQEIFDRVIDGELSNVSVGYRTHAMELVKESEDGPAIYRVTSWTPNEISIVSVPADKSVGVGRDDGPESRTISIPIEGNRSMPKEDKKEPDNIPAPTPVPAPAQVRQDTPAAPVDADQVRGDAEKNERTRISTIHAVANEFNMPLANVQRAVEEGVTVDAFRKSVLDHIKENQGDETTSRRGEIGLSEREVDDYRFTRLLAAQVFPNDKAIQEAARFELECAEAAAEQRSGEAQGYVVPMEVLRAPLPSYQSVRTVTVGAAAQAGNAVATNLAPSFIDLLYNKMMVQALGATMFNGLTGNVDFTKFISGSNGFWVGEDADVGEGGVGTGLVQLTPQTVGAFVELSRRTLLQPSHDIEAWVRRNLAWAVALQIDVKALNGDGTSDTPVGIANTVGIGAVDHGTNGGAPTWATMVQFETEVAADNADMGSLGYLVNSRTRGKLKTTEKAANTAQFIMGEGRDANGFAEMNGYRAGVSNQCRSTLTKGSGTALSEMFFGNWSDLYLGFWSGLDLLANPYSGDKRGQVRITALQDVDVAIARAESFAYANDVITV